MCTHKCTFMHTHSYVETLVPTSICFAVANVYTSTCFLLHVHMYICMYMYVHIHTYKDYIYV